MFLNVLMFFKNEGWFYQNGVESGDCPTPENLPLTVCELARTMLGCGGEKGSNISSGD